MRQYLISVHGLQWLHLDAISPISWHWLEWLFGLTIATLLILPYGARWVKIADEFFHRRPKLAWAILIILGVVGVGFYITLSVLRYRDFQLTVYDFGVYDQMMWKIAHFQPPGSLYEGTFHWLGDHFQPILYLLAPLYWVFNTPYTLLVIEPLINLSAVVPIFLLSRKHTRSSLLGYAVAVAYIIFPGNYFALHYTFHPSTLVPALLLWAFWAFDTDRLWYYWGFATLGLMCKENVGIYLAFFGLYALLFTPKRKIGLLTLLYGSAWSYLALTRFLPYFRHGLAYNYDKLDPAFYSQGSLTKTFYHAPLQFIGIMLNGPQKWLVVLTALTGFGLGAVLFYPFLLVLIPFFGERLASDTTAHFSQGFHYGAPIAAVLAYMAIRGSGYLIKWRPSFVGAAVAIVLIGATIGFRINSIIIPSFRALAADIETSHIAAANAAVIQIPPGASITAQDTLAVHISHRNQIILLDGFRPDITYALLDINPQTSFWPIPNQGSLLSIVLAYNRDPNFSLIFSQNTVAIWQKGATQKVAPSPQLNQFINQ